MLPADLTITKGPDGKPVMTFKSPSGVKYKIDKKLARGGFGITFRIIAEDGPNKGKFFVLKEFDPPGTDAAKKKQQDNVRKNLNHLIAHPVLDENDTPLKTMVAPIEIIDFSQTGSFGYLMNYVDLKEFKSVVRLFEQYPSADIVCKLCLGVIHFFNRLAGSAGLCYKDINEGNIYLNPRTGEVRIIDNDNVGLPKVRTVSGTDFYMAPEVQQGLNDPDGHTDRFQLALYLFRILLCAKPYDGPRALQYIASKNSNAHEAKTLEVIYGKEAVFCFDPKDKSNSIENLRIPVGLTETERQTYQAWQKQAERWACLPQELRDLFTKTFTAGYRDPGRQQRTTAGAWENAFKNQAGKLVKCRKCRNMTFGTSSKCFYCGDRLPTATCKHCGKTTSKLLDECIYCGKAWKDHPAATRPCPHCSHANPDTEAVCSACKKYVEVICSKCGKKVAGNMSRCPKCQMALYAPCPSCKKANPLQNISCYACKAVFPQTKCACSKCKRVNLHWYGSNCVECNAPLISSTTQNGTSARPIVQSSAATVNLPGNNTITLTFAVSLPNKRVGTVTFPYTFGSTRTVINADRFISSLKGKPLCVLLYHKASKQVYLQNCTGGSIKHCPAGAAQAMEAKNDERFPLTIGHKIRFSNEVSVILKQIT